MLIKHLQHYLRWKKFAVKAESQFVNDHASYKILYQQIFQFEHNKSDEKPWTVVNNI